LLVAGDFHNHALFGDVHDLGPEDVHHLEDAGPHGGFGMHLDQAELPANVGVFRYVGYLYDVDQFVQLFSYLLKGMAVALDNDGDPGDLGVLCDPHGEALYVVAAPGEQSRHPGENAWVVFH